MEQDVSSIPTLSPTPSENNVTKNIVSLLLLFALIVIIAACIYFLFFQNKKNFLFQKNANNNVPTKPSVDPSYQIYLTLQKYISTQLKSNYIPTTSPNFTKDKNNYSLIWYPENSENVIALERLLATSYTDGTFDTRFGIHLRQKAAVLDEATADTFTRTYFVIKENLSWKCANTNKESLCTATTTRNNVPYEFIVYHLPALQGDTLVLLCSFSKVNPAYGTNNFCLENNEKQLFK